MFDLQNYPLPESQQLLQRFQTQKQICQQYIKIASQQLYIKEAHLISAANDLLDKIASRQPVKDLSEWDVFSTRDSGIFDDDTSLNVLTFSQESKCKLIKRKSTIHGSRNSRQFQGSISQCLGNVQQHCSLNTVTTIKQVIEQYRKLKLKMFECEKKQKAMGSKEKLIEELQQKNSILTRKIQDIEHNLSKLKVDNTALKASSLELSQLLYQKNTEINNQKKIRILEEIISHHSINIQPHSTHNSSYDILTDIAKQKDSIIRLRYDQVKKLEEKLENQLFSKEQSCQKCCQVLKKMRTSITSYKGYLQREGEQFEKFVDNFKTRMMEVQVSSS